MNISDLIILSILFCLVLLIVQRTERRRLWLSALVLLLPAAFLTWRWAIYKNQVATALAAFLIALGINVIFWLVYGRRHPPGTTDSIRVIGTDD